MGYVIYEHITHRINVCVKQETQKASVCTHRDDRGKTIDPKMEQ